MEILLERQKTELLLETQKMELLLKHEVEVNALLTEKIKSTPTLMDGVRQLYQDINEIDILNHKLNLRTEDAKLKVLDLQVQQGMEVAQNMHRRNEALQDAKEEISENVYGALSFLSPQNANKSDGSL